LVGPLAKILRICSLIPDQGAAVFWGWTELQAWNKQINQSISKAYVKANLEPVSAWTWTNILKSAQSSKVKVPEGTLALNRPSAFLFLIDADTTT
jgi:hypothetical protein